MSQEAADELISAQRHGFVAHTAFGSVVLPGEGDAALVVGDQAMIGDSDAVRVARQVGQHRVWPGKGLLGIDVPVLLCERRQVLRERCGAGQRRQVAEELQLSVTVCLVKAFREQTPT